MLVMQWSDNREQAPVTGWRVIRSTADAVAFSRELRTAPRAIPGGQTSIAGAIEFAMGELATNGFEGNRRVIDVSGDGRANNGVHPMSLRDQAIEQGVTVNGLAILNEEPFLDDYFEHSVIGGRCIPDGGGRLSGLRGSDPAKAAARDGLRCHSGPPARRFSGLSRRESHNMRRHLV